MLDSHPRGYRMIPQDVLYTLTHSPPPSFSLAILSGHGAPLPARIIILITYREFIDAA